MSENNTVVEMKLDAPVAKDQAVVAETPKKAKKVSPVTLRKITTMGKKAHKEVIKLAYAEALERDANTGLDYVRSLLPPKQEGKLSRLGHMVTSQCGQLDEAILTCEKADVSEWLKAVAKANCETRKSNLEDNQTLAKRVHSHIRTLAGVKPNSLKKRLSKVHLEDKVEEIHNGFQAVELWYREHLNAAKF